MEDFSHNFVTFNRWNDERNVNVNRNDNDWNDNWGFAGSRNSPLSPLTRGVFFISSPVESFFQFSIPTS